MIQRDAQSGFLPPLVARVRYRGVRIYFSVGSAYDRQLLIEHLIACSHRKQHVEMDIGNVHWVLQGRHSSGACCPKCNGPMSSACHDTSSPADVCISCAIAVSAVGTSSPPTRRLASSHCDETTGPLLVPRGSHHRAQAVPPRMGMATSSAARVLHSM